MYILYIYSFFNKKKSTRTVFLITYFRHIYNMYIYIYTSTTRPRLRIRILISCKIKAMKEGPVAQDPFPKMAVVW